MTNISNIFTAALAPAMHPPDENPGDYREGGLLHCGTCHKAKEQRVDFLGAAHIVPIMCGCQEAAYSLAEAEEQKRRRLQDIETEINDLVTMGAADRPRATFQQNDGRSLKNTSALQRYVIKFDEVYENNIGLMLYGEAGNGKTFFAECVANALLKQSYFVWLSSIRAISAAMNGNHGDNRAYLLRRIRAVDLLILDDFGAERDTSYMNEQVFDIVNERYKAGKPLMVTTNLDPAAMVQEPNITARRIYERVMEMCTPLRIEGGTRRSAKAAGRTQTLKSILADN